MRQDGKLMLGTIRDFARMLSGSLFEGKWQDCDFGLADADDASTADLGALRHGVCGWYGVKMMPDMGFDSGCTELASDYYGGGCMSASQIDDGCTGFPDGAASDIEAMLISTLSFQEAGIGPDTLVIAEPAGARGRAPGIREYSVTMRASGTFRMTVEASGPEDARSKAMLLSGAVHTGQLEDVSWEAGEAAECRPSGPDPV